MTETSIADRLDVLARSSMDPVDAQAMREAAAEIRKYEAVHIPLAAIGPKRIQDMTRWELVDAVNALSRSYLAIAKANMNKGDVPVFHADMDAWNDKLRDWFYGNPAA